MKKFGIKTGSYALNTITPANVTATFNSVSAFIKTRSASSVNLSDGIGTGESNGNIKLGDYVDMGSLSVSAYNGNGTATPHLVFQFKNIPGKARMNSTDTNSGGYNASEMKTCLTGNYWAGLKSAGIPDVAVWSPLRKVGWGYSYSGGVQDVSDKLWLPIDLETFGNTSYSENPYETSANQGRLAYYSSADARIKYNSGNSGNWWWIADTNYYSGYAAYFCGGMGYGITEASKVGGCAPAFCVK